MDLAARVKAILAIRVYRQRLCADPGLFFIANTDFNIYLAASGPVPRVGELVYVNDDFAVPSRVIGVHHAAVELLAADGTRECTRLLTIVEVWR